VFPRLACLAIRLASEGVAKHPKDAVEHPPVIHTRHAARFVGQDGLMAVHS
jgi:hypothetical protein